MIDKEMMTRKEAASYMGICESRVHQLCSSNILPFYRGRGKKTYIKKSDIDKLCELKLVVK